MADSPHIIDVTRANFEQVIEASFRVPVLLDFWASWCQPCQVLMPVLAKLAEEYQGKFLLGKLNTEDEQEIAAHFGIRSIPNVKLFRDGRPVDEFLGALPERAVREFLDRHLPGESDAELAEARERLAAGDADAAIALLQAAREKDADSAPIALALAEALVASGDAAAAEAILDSLPPDEREGPEFAALNSRLFFAGQVSGAPESSELEARLAANPDDHEALHQLALRKTVEGDYDAAMELLLELMRKNRDYGDDAARRSLLNVFELLGEDARVNRYRRRMASLLH